MACFMAPLFPDHLGRLLTPDNGNSVESVTADGLLWGCDNGCFGGFDPDAFQRMLERVSGQPGLLWAVCPDVVADAKATLALWPWWSALIRSRGCRACFVLQDGQEGEPLPDADAYFVGGSTAWKLSQCAADLGAEAKRRGRWLHVGRVNTLRRLQAAFDMGADSVDGTQYSRFADTYLADHLRFVQSLERQPCLWDAAGVG